MFTTNNTKVTFANTQTGAVELFLAFATKMNRLHLVSKQGGVEWVEKVGDEFVIMADNLTEWIVDPKIGCVFDASEDHGQLRRTWYL